MAGIYRDKNQEFLREPTSIANMVRAFNEFIGSTLWQSGAVFSGARLNISSQSIANAINQDIAFNTTEDYDDGAWYDNGVSTTNVIVPVGVTRVMITGQVTWAGNITNERRLIAEVNGANVGEVRFRPTTALGVNQQVMAIVDVVATDVITLAVFQDSGIALNVTQGNFTVTKLG